MKKHWKYLRYVVIHKWFVFVAGRKAGVSPWRLLKHDWSKFLPCEWYPYVEYFYGEYRPYCGPDRRPNEEANKLDWTRRRDVSFDQAWAHHQHVNDHHWQHWLLVNDDATIVIMEMPEPCWREMVADWCGAGRAITGKWEAAMWYQKNKVNIRLHNATRLNVEHLLAQMAGEDMA